MRQSAWSRQRQQRLSSTELATFGFNVAERFVLTVYVSSVIHVLKRFHGAVRSVKTYVVFFEPVPGICLENSWDIALFCAGVHRYIASSTFCISCKLSTVMLSGQCDDLYRVSQQLLLSKVYKVLDKFFVYHSYTRKLRSATSSSLSLSLFPHSLYLPLIYIRSSLSLSL